MSNVEQPEMSSTVSPLDAYLNAAAETHPELSVEPAEPPQVEADDQQVEIVAEESEPETEAVMSENEEAEPEDSTEAISEEQPEGEADSFKLSDDDVLWQDHEGNDVTYKTAREQQLLHSDYTRKRQKEAAEHRQALESLTDKEQRLDWDLQIMADAAKAGLSRFDGYNWRALQTQDPAAYQEQKAEYAKAVSGVEYAEKARADRLESFEQQKQAIRQREAESAVAVLKEVIPEWSTEYYTELGQAAAKAGLPIETFNEITDPNLIVLIRNGLEFNDIKSRSTTKISKQVKKTMQNKSTESNATRKQKRGAHAMRKFKESRRADDYAQTTALDGVVDKLFN